MIKNVIGPDLVSNFEQASSKLIVSIRRAIDNFYQKSTPEWQQWEIWCTPTPWEDRVLPNLERYHHSLQEAKKAYEAGNVNPIVYEAAAYAGLSKDIDFSDKWMDENYRVLVQKAISDVVIIASNIHRLGYESLKSVDN